MTRILIIEDDELLRTTLTRQLQRAGHEVLVAESGVDGVRIALSESPDVVLTDLVMPEKEGFETLRELKSKRPELPVFVMTGGIRGASADNFLLVAKKLGAAAVLRKPFAVETLIDLLPSAVRA